MRQILLTLASLLGLASAHLPGALQLSLSVPTVSSIFNWLLPSLPPYVVGETMPVGFGYNGGFFSISVDTLKINGLSIGTGDLYLDFSQGFGLGVDIHDIYIDSQLNGNL